MKKKTIKEITMYDIHDSSSFIDRSKKMRLQDLGITLPKEPPTKVLSIRIPTSLLNSIKAYADDDDVPGLLFLGREHGFEPRVADAILSEPEAGELAPRWLTLSLSSRRWLVRL